MFFIISFSNIIVVVIISQGGTVVHIFTLWSFWNYLDEFQFTQHELLRCRGLIKTSFRQNFFLLNIFHFLLIELKYPCADHLQYCLNVIGTCPLAVFEQSRVN